MGKIVRETVDCSSAEDFLDAISPIGKYFYGYPLDSRLLFRGQGQDWSLIPSLFRKDALKKMTGFNRKTYNELRAVEADLLIRFFRLADKRGLILPDDSQELRTFFARLDGDYYEGVANNNEQDRIEDSPALSVIALAQHYGLPTRLLDWTLAPYVAAFFAGYDVYKHGEKNGYGGTLVVWAFYFPNFERQVRYTPASYVVRSVTAPTATNVNLKAQQGVFTLVNSENTGELDGRYLPLDKILENSPDKEKADLTKFTLPVSEAKSLLYLLAKLDITPSAIYPGYKSIVSDLKMLSDGGALGVL